jgi:hypothetical protein
MARVRNAMFVGGTAASYAMTVSSLEMAVFRSLLP